MAAPALGAGVVAWASGCLPENFQINVPFWALISSVVPLTTVATTFTSPAAPGTR